MSARHVRLAKVVRVHQCSLLLNSGLATRKPYLLVKLPLCTRLRITDDGRQTKDSKSLSNSLQQFQGVLHQMNIILLILTTGITSSKSSVPPSHTRATRSLILVPTFMTSTHLDIFTIYLMNSLIPSFELICSPPVRR